MKSIVGKGDMQFIVKIIDKVVHTTGYPAPAQVLRDISITREQLRYMERKGLLKSIPFKVRGQIIKGYYSPNVWPTKMPIQEPEAIEV